MLALSLVTAIMLGMTGCGEGVLKKKSDDTQANSVEGLKNGFFVLKKDGKKYEPDKKGETFNGIGNEPSDDRIIYNASGKSIPVCDFKAGDKIVCISDTPITDTITAEKFQQTGWTLPIKNLSMGTNGSYTFTKNDVLGGMASSNELINAAGNMVTLDAINGKSSFELSDTNALAGAYDEKSGKIDKFKKGKTYSLELYRGTIYKKVKVKADTRLYISSSIVGIDKLEYTKNGYAIIDTANLTDGFYSFNNTGLIEIKNLRKKAPVEVEKKDEQKTEGDTSSVTESTTESTTENTTTQTQSETDN